MESSRLTTELISLITDSRISWGTLLSEGGRAMDAISFNQGDFAGTLPQKIDIIYSFIINRYYKKPKVELEVHALGFSD